MAKKRESWMMEFPKPKKKKKKGRKKSRK